MNNVFKKHIAAISAMVVLGVSSCVTAVGILANADDEETPSTPTTTTSTGIENIRVTKDLYKKTSTYAPLEDFTIEIKENTGKTGSSVLGSSYPWSEGPSGFISFEPFTSNSTVDNDIVFSYAPSEADISITDSYDASNMYKSAMLYFNTDMLLAGTKSFNNIGYYRYTLQETEGSYDGIIYDKLPHYLYAFINYKNGKDDTDGYIIESIIYSKVSLINGVETEEKQGKGTTSWEEVTNKSVDNYYGMTWTNNYYNGTNGVGVKKQSNGTAASKTAYFEFEVKIKASKAGEWFRIVADDSTKTTTVKTDENGEATATISLKHNEGFKIWGLSESDTITVTELNAKSNGYTTYFDNVESALQKIIKNSDGTVKEVVGTVTRVETKPTVIDNGEIKVNPNYDENAQYPYFSGHVLSDGVEIKVQNERDKDTNTGFNREYLPYVMMLVMALGADTILLVTRRKNDESN